MNRKDQVAAFLRLTGQPGGWRTAGELLCVVTKTGGGGTAHTESTKGVGEGLLGTGSSLPAKPTSSSVAGQKSIPAPALSCKET